MTVTYSNMWQPREKCFDKVFNNRENMDEILLYHLQNVEFYYYSMCKHRNCFDTLNPEIYFNRNFWLL